MIRLNNTDREWIEQHSENEEIANSLIHYMEHNFERRIKFAKMKARAKALLEAIDSNTVDGKIDAQSIRNKCVDLKNIIRRDREDNENLPQQDTERYVPVINDDIEDEELGTSRTGGSTWSSMLNDEDDDE